MLDWLRRASTALKIKWLYRGIPTYSLSKAFRERIGVKEPDYIYGELAVKDFLAALSKLDLSNHYTLIDLGCGDAKLLLAAILHFKSINGIGYEMAPELVQAAKLIRARCQSQTDLNRGSLEIHERNFLTLSKLEASVIYLNASALTVSSWDRVQSLVCQSPGVQYILSVARRFEHGRYCLIGECSVRTSWGRATLYIYQKQEFR